MSEERTTDLVKPYRVQLVHDEDDRVIGVNIRAAEGELDLDVIQQATRSLIDHFRREQIRTMRPGDRLGIRRDPQPGAAPLRSQQTLRAMKAAYDSADGITSEYLLLLSAGYAELVGRGVNIAETLAEALTGDGSPVPVSTVRSHIKRARHDGFLTPTRQGKEDGQLTETALQLLKKSESRSGASTLRGDVCT